MIRFRTVHRQTEPPDVSPDSVVALQRTEESGLDLFPPLNLLANIFSIDRAYAAASLNFRSPDGAHAFASFQYEEKQISVLAESLKSGAVTSSIGAVGGCAVGWWYGLGVVTPALAGAALVGLCTAALQAWHLSAAQARGEELKDISEWASGGANFSTIERQFRQAGGDIDLNFSLRLRASPS